MTSSVIPRGPETPQRSSLGRMSQS
uniref:Uncharacterized protein n=1 Tax=Anguilla anguilla TaxID=7936 RepID=A0A0E9VFZ5_ANGAN